MKKTAKQTGRDDDPLSAARRFAAELEAKRAAQ